MVRCAAAVGLTHLNHGPGPGIESGAWGDGQMRITVELRTGHSHHDDYIARLPGQSAVLSGDGWSVPVQVAAVTMGTSEEEPQEPEGSPFGPEPRAVPAPPSHSGSPHPGDPGAEKPAEAVATPAMERLPG